jgi:hypothetical protein
LASEQEIEEAVYRAVDEVNGLLPPDKRLAKSRATALVGDDTVLDSLGLVNFIVVVESSIAEKLGVAISLISEESMSAQPSPFSTIGSLADYALNLTRKASHGPH